MKNLLSVLLIILSNSCSLNFEKNEFRIFEKHKSNNNYKEAIKSLNKIISGRDKKMSKKALLEKADLNIHILNNPEETILTYEQLADLSKASVEKNKYFYLIAKIYYDQLQNFDYTIKYLSKVTYEVDDLEQMLDSKILIAQAYKKNKKYYQSLIELNKAIAYSKDTKQNKQKIFDVLVLKAEILFLTNKVNESQKIFEILISTYPELSRKERIYLNLVSLYETSGNYKKAILILKSSLQKHPKNKEYIETKLSRLKELKTNMPGAKGLRR